MSKTPKISVIMPVYNTKEEWLREAIDSILNQTFSDFEFIIVDDGSSENNVEGVIKSYRDKRIKYFYKENSGVAKSLNFGLKKSIGEYIARMDSDDVSLSDRFEKQVKYLNNHPEISILGTAFEHFPKNKKVIHPTHVTLLDIFEGCFVAHPTVMFRRADFEKYDLKYNETFPCAQDYELWSRAVRLLKIANLSDVLLRYRVSESQISSRKIELQKSLNNEVKQNILNFLTDNKILQKKIKTLLLGAAKLKYYLFGFIPVLTRNTNGNIVKYKLFGSFTILKIKEK